MNDIIRILLIDDDEVDRMAFRRSLKKTSVVADISDAPDARTALELISSSQFDIIYLDYLLPGADGLNLLEQFRSRGVTAPVVVVTSQGDEKIAVQMMKAGASDYIPKSFLTSEGIEQGIKNILRVSEAEKKRKEAEARLVESEMRYRQIVESATDIIYKTDADGILNFINPVCEKITGYSEKELLGKNLFDLIISDEKEKIVSSYRHQVRSRLADNYQEFRIICKTGELLWLGQNSKLILTENKVSGILCVARDITARKVVEQELILSRLKAEEAVQIRERFLANMSHEIRTPMNAVIGFADLLLKSELNDDQLENVRAIRNSGENLLYLINEILDLSKIQAGKMIFEQVPFDLPDLLNQVKKTFSERAKEKNLNLTFVTENIPDAVCGDPYRLRQILLNLISNAVKFTEKGDVIVSCSRTGKDEGNTRITFKVKDTGIGIPPDKKEKVFESFTQAAEDTTRVYGGTGLGLSIVRNLIELQGGEIGIDSKVGEGTTISFWLDFGVSARTIVNEQKEADRLGFNFEGLKLLAAEDNPVNTLLLRKIFSDNGISADYVTDGENAIRQLSIDKYDILLMDVQMPVMDGITATKKIRSSGFSYADIPVIALTAHAVKAETDKCLSAGMNDFLTKPFKEKDLLATIQKWYKNSRSDTRQSASPEISAEPVTDLSYLERLAGGNKEFFREMIETFLLQSKEFETAVEQNYRLKNWEELKAAAHKFKSTLSVVKLNSLQQPVHLLEKTVDGTELSDSLISFIISQMEKSRAEMEKHLK
jgi:PAS domain S-box-containing protein